MASDLAIQLVFVEPVTVYTPEGSKLKLDDGESVAFQQIAVQAKRLAQKFGIETNLADFSNPALIQSTGEMDELFRGGGGFFTSPCYEPWLKMGIRSDGTVCPCGFFDEASWENVRERSLKQIWFGKFFNQRRSQLLRGELPAHCARCCVTLVAKARQIRSELQKFRYVSL
jgi:radical SAM protein with 4Fe4S-binding SPASM domain